MSDSKLEHLIGLLLDDTITSAEMNQLVQLVEKDQTALDLLTDQLAVSDLLSQYEDSMRDEKSFVQALETHIAASSSENEFIERVLGSTKKLADSSLRQHSRWRPRLFSLSLGVLAASVAFFLFYSLISSTTNPIDDNSLTAELTDNGVAVITRSVDAIWQDDQLLSIGSPVEPQEIYLKAGIIQLEFYSGASLIVEGPAKLQVLDAETAICRFGKVRAQVPQHARGFTILSPRVELVDLGTEFAMEVDAQGETLVQVYEGKVELYDPETNRNPDTRREITAGQVVEVLEQGETHPLDTLDTTFVSTQVLNELELQNELQKQQQWNLLNAQLKSDPRTLVYYDFQPNSLQQRKLINQSSETIASLAGAIVGCRWTTGRWPEKHALEFKRPSDRVRINIPGKYQALTFAAWVRVDGLDREFNTLLLTDRFDQGEPHWQINRAGQLILGIKHSKNHSHDYRSDPIMTLKNLGQWIHLATVYDPDSNFVRHYLNGKVIHEEKIVEKVTLKFGSAEIGNWGVPVGKNRNTIRNFNGQIDELIIFKAPLSQDEIFSFYEIGKPS